MMECSAKVNVRCREQAARSGRASPAYADAVDVVRNELDQHEQQHVAFYV
jgi:hypothetical protein